MSYSIIEDIDDMLGQNANQVPKNMRQPPNPVMQNATQMMTSFNTPSPSSMGRYNNLDTYHSYNPQKAMYMHDRNDVASKYYEKQDRVQPRLSVPRISVNALQQDEFQHKTNVKDVVKIFREEEMQFSDKEKGESKKEKKEKREKDDEFRDLTNLQLFSEIHKMSTVFTNLLQRHDDHVDMLRKKIECIEMTQKGILFLLFIILLLVLLKSNHTIAK
jgi:hypothetical protein